MNDGWTEFCDMYDTTAWKCQKESYFNFRI